MHDEVTVESGVRTLRPHTAIVLYGNQRDAIRYAMEHPLHEIDGDYQLGAGHPLRLDSLSNALDALAKHQGGMRLQGLLPANVLTVAYDRIAWWCPPSVRTVFFRDQPNVRCMQPGLVFVATSSNLFVGALKGRERPQATDPVYDAPYFNVWRGGKMCVGNVELPGQLVAEKIAAWESAFFDSLFTHPNGSDLVEHKGGLTGLWQMLGEQGAALETFPEDVLTLMNRATVQQFLQVSA